MQSDSSGPQTTVLVIDDNPANRYLISRILGKEGFRVLEAATGSEGLRLAKEKPDLILLDLHLPDLNGFDVCRAIKADQSTSSIPVVHLTAALISPEYWTKALECGSDGYLPQPIDPGVMVATINALIRVRKAEAEVRAAARQWQATFDAIRDGVCLADLNGRILRCNQAFTELTRRPIDGILGHTFQELGSELVPPVDESTFLRMIAEKRRQGFDLRIQERLYHLSIDPVFDGEENVTGAVCIVSDITGRKQHEEQVQASLREKEVLLKEIHHRVKNNLQIVSSLLNLQSSQIKDEQARALLESSRNRVQLMASIHESLYSTENLANIEFSEYISSLARQLFRARKVSSAAIELKVSTGNVSLDVDSAILCGLIMSELVSNALQHAFPDGRDGEISIDFSAANETITLLFKDTGVGLPPDVDFRQTTSLGLQLVTAFVDQLDGKIEYRNNGGAEFRIEFGARKPSAVAQTAVAEG